MVGLGLAGLVVVGADGDQVAGLRCGGGQVGGGLEGEGNRLVVGGGPFLADGVATCHARVGLQHAEESGVGVDGLGADGAENLSG